MKTGWRYRLAAIVGASILVSLSVFLANLPPVQSLLTSVPIFDRLQPSTLTSGNLQDEIMTTLIIVLGALWPLFKPRPRRILDVISLTHKRVFLASALLATIGYFDWSTRLSRSTLISVTVILAVIMPVWFVYIRKQPLSSSRAILVGDDTDAMEQLYASAGIPILGFVAPPTVQLDDSQVADGGVVVEQPGRLTRLGGLSRLDQVLVEYDIDTVLLGFGQPDRQEFFGAISTCYEHGVQAKVHREQADSVLVAEAAGGDLIDTDLEPWDWQDYVVKRLFDIMFASTTLLILVPVVILIAASIKLDSPGPVLYKQQRTATFGETFWVYKFRTMTLGNANSEPTCDSTNERITRVGTYLRRTHLDEIPQLWSILVGHMSVVGPRAAWTDEERHLETETNEWRKRWFVKPGLTGLAQINGLTSENPGEKLRYDVEYIRKQSFWFDMKIVVRQIYSVGLDLASIVNPTSTENQS